MKSVDTIVNCLKQDEHIQKRLFNFYIKCYRLLNRLILRPLLVNKDQSIVLNLFIVVV